MKIWQQTVGAAPLLMRHASHNFKLQCFGFLAKQVQFDANFQK